jgi:hypothetical protein
MGYIVTTKIGYYNGNITRFPIAFPDTDDNLAVFDTWCNWEEWSNTNYDDLVNGVLSIEEHCTNHPNCYEGNIHTESIDGMELTIMEII